MAFTYDLATDRGKVRLLLKDTDEANPIFQDEEIDVFLDLEAGDVRRATAAALEVVASDEALTTKVVRILDLAVDGATLARALLQRAAALRAQAAEADAREDAGFEVAEIVVDDFGARERIANQALRGAY